MTVEYAQDLCAECLKRDGCGYAPPGGRLLRCLDRETATPSPYSAPAYPGAANATKKGVTAGTR